VSRLAVIPARGGSKRIPRKNIKLFNGRPILSYSIAAALESGLFDEVMVSTDDQEIAEIARAAGATVPFFRRPETANDHAGILEVLKEVVEDYRTLRGTEFEFVCCLLPTAPLLRVEDLKTSHEKLISEGWDSVFPVVRFGYPILRSLTVENGRAVMNWPENYPNRSQDLPPAFHDVGQFYWIRPERCFALGRIFTENSGVIELPETRVQDIDTEEDWKIAELKYRLATDA
jgi:N-acylneuraminate cytidylyltransferase